ncbi:RNA polymerase subunit sigma-24 [Streptomyces sp. V4-01]|uniref:RNA polymerase subunit sigma-24 n=1 Tax=Actinacidiphila polyblastidii TaxID=3110430 RepID=A0ABU7PI87_9ACTN|nr:RNA polymerase subunit sigma-24 [Streptomyces sp. V4-01]
MDGLRGEGGGAIPAQPAGAAARARAAAEGPQGQGQAETVRLFAAAYRMLGSAAAAEQVVREVLAAGPDGAAADGGAPDLDALVRAVFAAVLHRADVARPRREAHPGPWLPEPVLTAGGALGPLSTPALRAAVSMPRLVLLERMPPAERACSVLQELFGYGPAGSAAVLGLAETRCAALEHRARQRLREDEGAARTAADEEARRPAVQELLRAATEADQEALEVLLADDVVAWSDGGGSGVPRRPVLGVAKVARFLAGLLAKAPMGTWGNLAEVNGDAAVVATVTSGVVGALVPEFGPQRLVVGVRTISDPARLAYLGRQWAAAGATAAVPAQVAGAAGAAVARARRSGAGSPVPPPAL